MKTLKKILNIVIDVIIALIFVISIFVLIASISSQKNNGVPSVFGYTFSTVETDSMSGFFEVDDVVIGKKVSDPNTLVKGDVISFFQKVNGVTIINTHRIYSIQEIDGIKYFTTKGDNETEVDSAVKSGSDIISLYQGKIVGFGKVVDFFKSTLGFILCVVLPFAIIIIYEIFKLVRTYILYSTNKDASNTSDQAAAELSDEAKNAIIQEYLAKQAQQNKEEKKEDNT